MANNTEWFEALGIEEVKEEQDHRRALGWQVPGSDGLLCVLAYATNS